MQEQLTLRNPTTPFSYFTRYCHVLVLFLCVKEGNASSESLQSFALQARPTHDPDGVSRGKRTRRTQKGDMVAREQRPRPRDPREVRRAQCAADLSSYSFAADYVVPASVPVITVSAGPTGASSFRNTS